MDPLRVGTEKRSDIRKILNGVVHVWADMGVAKIQCRKTEKPMSSSIYTEIVYKRRPCLSETV
jgi:hypothetical protein